MTKKYALKCDSEVFYRKMTKKYALQMWLGNVPQIN
jgi:hypothetical protein